MSTEPGDGFKAIADFWTARGTAMGKAMLEAQQGAARSMMAAMQSMFGPGTKSPGATPDLAAATQAMTQLWAAATELSTRLAGQLNLVDGDGAVTTDVLARLTDPTQWMAGNGQIDQALARLADGPKLADLWDVERRYAGVLRRWTDLRQRSIEHQRVVLEAWMQAGQDYMAELGRTAAQPLEPKQAVALWIEIGNRQMLKVQRSEPFLQSQRNLIRASTELRLAQAEFSEFLGKQYGLPTRSELDEVHRTVTEMRREMRKLRRELAAARQPTPAAEALPGKVRANASRSGRPRREAR